MESLCHSCWLTKIWSHEFEQIRQQLGVNWPSLFVRTVIRSLACSNRITSVINYFEMSIQNVNCNQFLCCIILMTKVLYPISSSHENTNPGAKIKYESRDWIKVRYYYLSLGKGNDMHLKMPWAYANWLILKLLLGCTIHKITLWIFFGMALDKSRANSFDDPCKYQWQYISIDF